MKFVSRRPYADSEALRASVAHQIILAVVLVAIFAPGSATAYLKDLPGWATFSGNSLFVRGGGECNNA